ncbi:uncharacterized protein DUF2721 [Pontibacter ummariensis]|uniref:Uncharacterized protein n=1 Tax=Pontibacter ummariensis TaxID=1610492 RepID=A0A239JT94_9BACT|nr:DUF2721 domain-containing protein [Pontibacter ummariensis]PRY07427.1 uncharacterized protein DUF2721 [Pontibacter ummariensis]SNT09176.1 Protein of unknown function [Pontibacter ummariensis]
MPTLSDLSAMITPVVLILAAGQLILTTSQRLARSVERARKLSEQFEELVLKKEETNSAVTDSAEKRELLYKLLTRAANRSRKLQQVMSLLYIALSIFVATSLSIGLLEVFGLLVIWVPVVLGLCGAGFLFYATILLISETRIALGAIDIEMDYLVKNYSKELPDVSPAKKA